MSVRQPIVNDQWLWLQRTWQSAEHKLTRVHSPACFADPCRTCRDCVGWLCQFRFSDWPHIARRKRREMLAYPPPLSQTFVERLALELAEHPELFAPIIQHLAAFQRSA
jgi:hypothetical protein